MSQQPGIYICDKCDGAGCADCNKGIDERSETIARLQERVKELEAQLETYTHGIPVEQAAVGETYFYIIGGRPIIAEQCRVTGEWFPRYYAQQEPIQCYDRLYYLPKPEQEGE